MDKIRKLILFRIPMSICNFRCHYCYLAQRDEHYQGIQPEMKFTPEQVRKAMSKERLGGPAYMNFCADGETLLVTNLDQYVKELVEEGLRRPLLYPAELQTRINFIPVYRLLTDHSVRKRVMGIEPTYPAWKAGVLPLNYTREVGVTGFEPATSWSQTRRSSQAEPHPVIRFRVVFSVTQ